MVPNAAMTASAQATESPTAAERGRRHCCRTRTSGASTKLSSTAKAIGTRISLVRYNAATVIATFSRSIWNSAFCWAFAKQEVAKWMKVQN